jgi:hypothetical protein
VDGVKVHLGVTDTRDDVRLASIVAAVNAKVRRWPCVEPARGAEDWTDAEDVVEGANLLASRLFRRKNSPAGVEAFGADGLAYVQRSDPDIAMMLGLGPWQGPAVG